MSRDTGSGAPEPGALVVLPVPGVPEIRTGDDVGAVLAQALAAGPGLREGDVLVVSAKLISKSLGLRAPASHKAAHVLAESRRVVAERRTPTGLTRVVNETVQRGGVHPGVQRGGALHLQCRTLPLCPVGVLLLALLQPGGSLMEILVAYLGALIAAPLVNRLLKKANWLQNGKSGRQVKTSAVVLRGGWP